MNAEEISKKIAPRVKDGKISCKKALEFAEKEKISTSALGEALNELKIKVVSCQLGCFP